MHSHEHIIWCDCECFKLWVWEKGIERKKQANRRRSERWKEIQNNNPISSNIREKNTSANHYCYEFKQFNNIKIIKNPPKNRLKEMESVREFMNEFISIFAYTF